MVWTAQSQNFSESMSCGDSDNGLNVWDGNGEMLFYPSRTGAFNENNVFPKIGRLPVNLLSNPFDGSEFRQEMKLRNLMSVTFF